MVFARQGHQEAPTAAEVVVGAVIRVHLGTDLGAIGVRVLELVGGRALGLAGGEEQWEKKEGAEQSLHPGQSVQSLGQRAAL